MKGLGEEMSISEMAELGSGTVGEGGRGGEHAREVRVGARLLLAGEVGQRD